MKMPGLFLLFFAIIIFLSGCKKEEYLPVSGSGTGTVFTQPSFEVVTSAWKDTASMTWTEATDSTGVSLYTDMIEYQLTQDIIDDDAVIVYARNAADGSIHTVPAAYGAENNTVSNIYHTALQPYVIRLTHTSFDGDASTTPGVNNDLSFRYIMVKMPPSAYGRIVVNGMEYYMEQLKRMRYEDVTALLGVTE